MLMAIGMHRSKWNHHCFFVRNWPFLFQQLVSNQMPIVHGQNVMPAFLCFFCWKNKGCVNNIMDIDIQCLISLVNFWWFGDGFCLNRKVRSLLGVQKHVHMERSGFVHPNNSANLNVLGILELCECTTSQRQRNLRNEDSRILGVHGQCVLPSFA